MRPVDVTIFIEPAPRGSASTGEIVQYLHKLVDRMNDIIRAYGGVVNDLVSGQVDTAKFTVQFSPPVTPQTGWVAYADGTSWDPGSGEGIYVYKSDNAWHKITTS